LFRGNARIDHSIMFGNRRKDETCMKKAWCLFTLASLVSFVSFVFVCVCVCYLRCKLKNVAIWCSWLLFRWFALLISAIPIKMEENGRKRKIVTCVWCVVCNDDVVWTRNAFFSLSITLTTYHTTMCVMLFFICLCFFPTLFCIVCDERRTKKTPSVSRTCGML